MPHPLPPPEWLMSQDSSGLPRIRERLEQRIGPIPSVSRDQRWEDELGHWFLRCTEDDKRKAFDAELLGALKDYWQKKEVAALDNAVKLSLRLKLPPGEEKDSWSDAFPQTFKELTWGSGNEREANTLLLVLLLKTDLRPTGFWQNGLKSLSAKRDNFVELFAAINTCISGLNKQRTLTRNELQTLIRSGLAPQKPKEYAETLDRLLVGQCFLAHEGNRKTVYLETLADIAEKLSANYRAAPKAAVFVETLKFLAVQNQETAQRLEGIAVAFPHEGKNDHRALTPRKAAEDFDRQKPARKHMPSFEHACHV